MKAHENAAGEWSKVAAADPVVPGEWVKQIQEMAEKHSQREGRPVEQLEVIFKKDGSMGSLLVRIARNAKRTANDARENHEVCQARVEGKERTLKLSAEEKVEGPDRYELLASDQLTTAAAELSAARALQRAFVKNGLNYTLQANLIVAPGGKSWAWEIAPSEEQSPNVIYALYYYPITRELRSVRLDNGKAAAKLEKAAKDAGLQLKWVKDMNER